MKKQFDISRIEGRNAAEVWVEKGYEALMALTPKERYDWLVRYGWTRLEKLTVAQPVVSPAPYVRCNWKYPDGFRADWPKRWTSQTEAIHIQLWRNLASAGRLTRKGTTQTENDI